MIGVRIKGTSAVKLNIAKITEQYQREVGRALLIEGELVRTAAVQIAPHDLGHLRNSIAVEDERDGSVITKVIVSAGGAPGSETNTYAIAVHEGWRKDPRSGKMVQLRPRKSGTQIKYLEQPFFEAVKGMTQRIAQRVKSAIGA